MIKGKIAAQRESKASEKSEKSTLMSFFKQKESKPQTENLAMKATGDNKASNEVKEAPLKEAS